MASRLSADPLLTACSLQLAADLSLPAGLQASVHTSLHGLASVDHTIARILLSYKFNSKATPSDMVTTERQHCCSDHLLQVCQENLQ